MTRKRSNREPRWRGKALIALFAMVAATMGGAQALVPAPAAAILEGGCSQQDSQASCGESGDGGSVDGSGSAEDGSGGSSSSDGSATENGGASSTDGSGSDEDQDCQCSHGQQQPPTDQGPPEQRPYCSLARDACESPSNDPVAAFDSNFFNPCTVGGLQLVGAGLEPDIFKGGEIPDFTGAWWKEWHSCNRNSPDYQGPRRSKSKGIRRGAGKRRSDASRH